MQERYNQIREEMLNEISRYCTPSLNILLFGDEYFNHNNNFFYFIAVQKYIFESKRFKS